MQSFLVDFLNEYAEKFSYEAQIEEEIGLIVTQYGQIGFNIVGDGQLTLRKVEPLDDDNDDQITALIKIKKHFSAALKKALEAHKEEPEEPEIPPAKPAKVAAPAKPPVKKTAEAAPPDAPVEPDPVEEEEEEVDDLGRTCPKPSNAPPKHFTKPDKPAKKETLTEQPPAQPQKPVPGTKAYADQERATQQEQARIKAAEERKVIEERRKSAPVDAPVKPAPRTVPTPPPKAAPAPVPDDGELAIVPARREMAFIKMLISSPSGGGKTLGALLTAFGLTGDWSKILIIDTENRSGSLYAGSEIDGVKIGQYQTIVLNAPYTVARYTRAIEMAEKAGIECLIIDSLSHAWTAEGGLLDLHTKITAASRTGNSYTAWKDVTPLHAKLIEKIMNCSMHVILTARSKTEYVLNQTEKGMTPKKVGMGIVFRDGLEYDVSIAMEVDQLSHTAQVTKDRTRIFADEPYIKLTPDAGQRIKDWLTE